MLRHEPGLLLATLSSALLRGGSIAAKLRDRLQRHEFRHPVEQWVDVRVDALGATSKAQPNPAPSGARRHESPLCYATHAETVVTAAITPSTKPLGSLHVPARRPQPTCRETVGNLGLTIAI